MRLNVTLDESASKAFQEIKNHMGVHTNTSVIGLLISREEDRIRESRRRKVFLPNEIYDKAEKAAKARGQMIYEYIDEITDALLKSARARSKTEKRKERSIRKLASSDSCEPELPVRAGRSHTLLGFHLGQQYEAVALQSATRVEKVEGTEPTDFPSRISPRQANEAGFERSNRS